jgi:hypothetical protein
MKVWTKDEIKDLMDRRDDVLITCMVRIYNQQTETEQSYGETTEANGVGFNGCDANILSSFCVFYSERGYLSSRQIEIARKKMKKYAGQVTKLANLHEQTKAERIG